MDRATTQLARASQNPALQVERWPKLRVITSRTLPNVQILLFFFFQKLSALPNVQFYAQASMAVILSITGGFLQINWFLST